MWPRTGLPGAKRRTRTECRNENVFLTLSCEWGSIACEKIACNRTKMKQIENENKGLQRNFTRCQLLLLFFFVLLLHIIIDNICYWNFSFSFFINFLFVTFMAQPIVEQGAFCMLRLYGFPLLLAAKYENTFDTIAPLFGSTW